MDNPFIFNDEILALNHLNIRPGATVFDVGCSYGEYTLEVIKKIKGPFDGHCFEPVSELCEIQRERFKDHPYIKINNFGIADFTGERILYRIKAPGNQAAEGCSSLTLRPEFITNRWPWRPENCRFTTLDKYIEENNVKHIHLMKIDVEGAELAVLKGGEWMFRKGMVDVIQFEYNLSFKDAGTTMADVRVFIKPFNYLLADYIGGKYVEITNFIEDYGFHNYYLINKNYFEIL